MAADSRVARILRQRGSHEGRREGLSADGFTLVELLVVMMLTALLMAILAPLLGAAGAASETSRNSELASATGSVALESIETQVGSASVVCLLSSSGAAPSISPSCPSPALSGAQNAVQVLTSAFGQGAQHYQQWWYVPPGTKDPNGTIEEQNWPVSGLGPVSSSLVAGSSSTGADACSVAPGTSGLFVLSENQQTGTELLTISLQVTCGQGGAAATVSMSTTSAALDAPPQSD